MNNAQQQLVQSVRNVRLSPNRAAGIIVWLIGAYTTALAIKQMGVVDETPSFLLGGLIQGLMTILERPIWTGLRVGWVSGTAVFFDGLFNFGGVWQFASKLDHTAAWSSINEAMGSQQAIPLITKAIIALVISLAIAAAPETLWREG